MTASGSARRMTLESVIEVGRPITALANNTAMDDIPLHRIETDLGVNRVVNAVSGNIFIADVQQPWDAHRPNVRSVRFRGMEATASGHLIMPTSNGWRWAR